MSTDIITNEELLSKISESISVLRRAQQTVLAAIDSNDAVDMSAVNEELTDIKARLTSIENRLS
ncbi:MAG: hypothetical protein IKO41_21575 [Lachnospiraceae bacterium]|nr:hypothetical protein [Lachnospiraceae bacterium]